MERRVDGRPLAMRRRLTDALARVTGYRRRRTDPAAADQALTGATPATPGRGTDKGAGRGKQTGRKTAKPAHLLDQEATALIARVQPRTMTSPEKLYPLILAVRHIVAARIEGDFVECGVWRGGSMQAIAWTLLAEGVKDRDLHLFDTFEGMPPPGEHDRRTKDHRPADELMRQHDRTHRVWAYAGLEDVREGMVETAYPEDRVHYVPGMVEDTVPAQAPDRIALLRLDTDWYSSTLHELDHLYPRLAPGGVLILDDYGAWDGARRATEEYLDTIDDKLLLLPIGDGRLAVKPH